MFVHLSFIYFNVVIVEGKEKEICKGRLKRVDRMAKNL
jgi:hypothetical protein